VTRLLDERGAEVWHCDWRGLLERARELGGVDALIFDAPYSERTHDGHDVESRDGAERRELDYPPFTEADVRAFVQTWAPLTRGWIVSITDHVLAPVWASALAGVGRYVFPHLPMIEHGGTVRLTGDGPSPVSVFGVVARPRSREFSRWGTLPGFYTVPRERKPVVGGKPIAMMRAIVRDYSRPGDLVCDPTCGAGTTGLAAIMEGRRALLGDAMEEHARLAADRLRAAPGETKAGQLALLG